MHSIINTAEQLISSPGASAEYSPLEGRIACFLNYERDYQDGDQLAKTKDVIKALEDAGAEVQTFAVASTLDSNTLVSDEKFTDAFWLQNNSTLEENKLSEQVQALEEHFDIYRPQLIWVTSNYLEAGLSLFIAAARLGLPFIVDMRGTPDITRYLPNWLVFALRSASRLIVDDEQYLAYFASQGVDSTHIDVVDFSFSFDPKLLAEYIAIDVRADSDCGANTFYQQAKTILDAPYVPELIPAKSSPKEYRVLTIMDEFTQHCFQDEFMMIPASSKKWLNQLETENIDFVFVESAWRGNQGSWSYSVSKIQGKFGTPLMDLLLECRKRGIPTVFWNKEDPVNFDVFIDAARFFDYIFTTDESVIERYKEECGHERVYLLKFAAHDRMHAPILRGQRNGRVAFAGSWNGLKYPIRGERLNMLFKYPLEQGVLDIYDRYSGDESADPGLTYPEKYETCLLPAVPYKKIADTVYKKYSIMLNVNSVENSDSMLARRIYELCGCGTPIVSSPSAAINNELAGVVKIASTPEEAEQHIRTILEDDIQSLRISANGVRFIHSENTYRHRFEEIISKVTDAGSVPEDSNFAVTAICVSKRPWFAENTAQMFRQQNGVDVHVVYVAHGDETSEAEVTALFSDFASFKFLRMVGDDKVLADGLNLALEHCETDLVAKVDDDDYYGPNYLLDSCLALSFSGAVLVGKASFFCYVESSDDFALRFPDKHYRYLSRVHGGTLVWSREMTQYQTFTQVRQGTDSYFIQGLKEKNLKVYSGDPFNFVHVRYASNNAHTWAIDDDEFLNSAKKLGKGLDLEQAYN